jgi:hypothetical protein
MWSMIITPILGFRGPALQYALPVADRKNWIYQSSEPHIMKRSRFLSFTILLALTGLAGSALAASALVAGVGEPLEVPAIPVALPDVPSPADPLAADTQSPAAKSGSARKPTRAYRWFPALYSPQTATEAPPPPAGAVDDIDTVRFRDETESRLPILANNQILAFYGHPLSRRMGILGEYPKDELAGLIKGYARLYDDANGSMGVVPAFYLIYGTCWPGGEIGYLKTPLVEDYIEFARREGMLVFVDHQIGRHGVVESLRRLLPFLRYPNVHLALDPEWRTTSPMKEIGAISAEELNAAQSELQDYMDREGIPGVKMLVVHQFKGMMIEGRERVRADFERVLLVHTADGFGAPALKKYAYAFNARASNMPLKGFKLFFRSSIPGAGFDEPLLTPDEVLALEPRPAVIIYQ